MVLPKKVVIDGLPFCDYIPQPFTSLARNKKGLIAAGRLDGSIDVYDESDNFYLIHHIPSWILTSIYAICWSNTRLFATGGEGCIFELSVVSIHPKANLLLPGGLPARSLVSYDGGLISGNDGGYINVVEVADGSFDLKSCLTKVEGKILSLAVDETNGFTVAAGDSEGKIHLFDLRNGATLSVYAIGDEHSTVLPVAWSLTFVGNTLFSGDSRGNVCVWDIEVGALVSSFRSHAADVLALAVSKDNQSVFAAGADPIIQRFDLCQTGCTSQWQPSCVIGVGGRDIRSLLFVQRGESGCLRPCSVDMDHLIAAGNDARLQILPCPPSNLGDKVPISRPELQKRNDLPDIPAPFYLPFWPLSVTPTLPLDIHFARSTFMPNYGHSARLCLVQHEEYMCLYRLPPKAKRAFHSKDSLRYFTKLAQIRPKQGSRVISSCISPCGKFMAYSDDVRTRILKIAHPKSWKLNPNDPVPLVSISRLGWARISRRRFRGRASSLSSDSDNTGSEADPSRFLSLDQSSADLFVNNIAGRDVDFDEHLVSRKRKLTTSKVTHPSVEGCHKNESSALPPASLMAFSPSSACLLCVSIPAQQVVCRRLDTGVAIWKLAPQSSLTNGTPSPIHLLKMAQLCPESANGGPVTLLAVAPLGERVSVYAFTEASSNQGPQHLFTCPLAADPFQPGRHPRPLAIALRVTRRGTAELGGEAEVAETSGTRAQVAILYTTGQLTEWRLPLRLSGSTVHLVGAPQADTWLADFWQRNHAAWRRRMPRFHSLDYFFSSRILMLASRRFCLTVDRRKQITSNAVRLAFCERYHKSTTGCLRIFGQLSNMLRCTVLADRIAALKMNGRAAIDRLPAPLKKKRFGI
ncbi:unnamed protein product [Hydatigera taeniaeformis]|uniref:WD_REPEATS_REGION domain-containing protein n=1 Tax=Hydatigena taeniaeformis TaxID=6205 RepID=A0A0R3X6D1_HYDTA|nr:unnamed protein product [Hydatigera taeniaeformis]